MKKRVGILMTIIFIVIIIIIILLLVIPPPRNNCTKIGILLDNLHDDVSKAWNSEKDNFEFQGTLPKEIKYICFVDFSKDNFTGPHESDDISKNIKILKNTECEGESCNLIIFPIENTCNIANDNIPHIDIEKITQSENPYCISVKKGEIIFQIKKDLGERLVNII